MSVIRIKINKNIHGYIHGMAKSDIHTWIYPYIHGYPYPRQPWHFQSCSRSLVHSSKEFTRLKLSTWVKIATLICTHKRPKDPKWRPEVSSLHDLVSNSMDRGPYAHVRRSGCCLRCLSDYSLRCSSWRQL